MALLALLQAYAADRLYVNNLCIKPGQTTTVTVQMLNELDYTAFQTDIRLPEGLSVVMNDGELGFSLSSRATSGHQISSLLRDDGTIRVIAYTFDVKPFAGTSGALFSFQVTAGEGFEDTSTITCCNSLFTTVDGDEVALPDVSCLVINGTLGDVNRDGTINIADINMVVNIILGANVSDQIMTLADVNCDGAVTISDINLLINMILS